ncbi:hypothetical protein [Aliiroseovarius sp. F20344]|uniref:hypothetical protein n=1 Tax=Aliiroseovarius sp. F20344 TaxID=2926414 RepID=UPI001FF5F194|nr:hypothetical protein [Aliiroseovarius sp. F20344]MCK0141981.1 hypothetical protein [Aliiroseovarius sp. F20344]
MQFLQVEMQFSQPQMQFLQLWMQVLPIVMQFFQVSFPNRVCGGNEARLHQWRETFRPKNSKHYSLDGSSQKDFYRERAAAKSE